MANSPHIQDVRRAITRPSFDNKSLEGAVGSIQSAYSTLAQEVVAVHNRFYVDQVAVGGGVGNLVVTLPEALPDISYTPVAILDWAAYAYITAISVTAFTLTFSAASPGGGGTIRLIVIR